MFYGTNSFKMHFILWSIVSVSTKNAISLWGSGSCSSYGQDWKICSMPTYVERSFLLTIQVNTKSAPPPAPPAVLITGGYREKTAELFLPSTGTSCALPNLPELRYYHSADNNILCGGSTNYNGNCLQWSPDTGTWEELLTLDVGRTYHVSWTPASGTGTYLIGGYGSDIDMTTTLITPEGGQEIGFLLKYRTE